MKEAAVLDDRAAIDAAAVAVLETEIFTAAASFDAMGRPVTKTTPDGSVMHLGYGDAGDLETVAANDLAGGIAGVERSYGAVRCGAGDAFAGGEPGAHTFVTSHDLHRDLW